MSCDVVFISNKIFCCFYVCFCFVFSLCYCVLLNSFAAKTLCYVVCITHKVRFYFNYQCCHLQWILSSFTVTGAICKLLCVCLFILWQFCYLQQIAVKIDLFCSQMCYHTFFFVYLLVCLFVCSPPILLSSVLEVVFLISIAVIKVSKH